MKNIILILLLIITSCTQSTDNYGEIITKNNISNLPSVISELKNSGQIETTLSGKIISTCPKKGCWMRVETGNDTLFIKFRDYGFFVPKSGVDGKKVVFKGTAFYDTVSVADRKHYAQDAGKSKDSANKRTLQKLEHVTQDLEESNKKIQELEDKIKQLTTEEKDIEI